MRRSGRDPEARSSGRRDPEPLPFGEADRPPSGMLKPKERTRARWCLKPDESPNGSSPECGFYRNGPLRVFRRKFFVVSGEMFFLSSRFTFFILGEKVVSFYLFYMYGI